MQIRTELEITAAPERVWKLLLDFPRYPQWNPFIVQISGKTEPGSVVSLTLSLPDSNQERKLRGQLVKCDPERELRWLVHVGMKGLFDAEHFLQLTPSGSGRTRLVQGADISGVLVRFTLPRVTEITRGFVYMNQAVQRRLTTEQGQPQKARG